MTVALAGKRGCLYENERESAGISLKSFIFGSLFNEKPAGVGAAHNLVNLAHKVADSAHKVRDSAHNKSHRLTITAALAGKRGCLYENERESAGISLKPFILGRLSNEKPAGVGAAHNLVNLAHKVADSAHNRANPAHKVRDLAHNKSRHLNMTTALARKRGCLYENDREAAGISLK
ncbi:hypothetical protein [Bacillus suaedae]|uniref:Uncharacterized protein n=1 Tax=Halalkalibacter suaedae TaxID=2822140 RepID=A0A940WXQ0_9BACI|nr:hypothetical protein [Bacillus suaedae]MBP3950196.1 hypothetical protein [Bacillus suaedae]